MEYMNEPEARESDDQHQGGPPRDAAPPVWTSAELFGDANEIQIVHGSHIYRLRRTRSGKLILNK